MRKGRRERIEKGNRKRIKRKRQNQFEEVEEEHHHFPLLVDQLPQGHCGTPMKT